MITPIDNVKMWTGDMAVEDAAIEQIRNIASLPILAGHIAIMPDVHMGKGATVGSVIPTRSAIIPAAVGVDIGCGMAAVMTNLTADDLPASLFSLRNAIERKVPVGFNEHKKGLPGVTGPYADVLRKNMRKIVDDYDKLQMADLLGHANVHKVSRQVGTLGGGNHFIEICLDSENRVWVMLHSGSRGIGNLIGSIAIDMAKVQASSRDWGLVDKDLAWLDEGTKQFDFYIEAMTWAQNYARFNRDTMMNLVLGVMLQKFPQMKLVGEVVNCHHNFTSLEEHFGEKIWVTRKGAVSAREGQLGIIPGSMGAKSFIVKGKGHEDAYCSCSHGAGRKMSRNGAKKAFNIEDLEAQTAGVECRKDSGVIDEIPGAYKDIDQVMAAQTDLVEVVHTLKQILCIKG
ncbi:MAG TPA: RtcB family protein [Methanosarcina sp.]|nr:RtcB family protein [Methanosarcina sp.]